MYLTRFALVIVFVKKTYFSNVFSERIADFYPTVDGIRYLTGSVTLWSKPQDASVNKT